MVEEIQKKIAIAPIQEPRIPDPGTMVQIYRVQGEKKYGPLSEPLTTLIKLIPQVQ